MKPIQRIAFSLVGLLILALASACGSDAQPSAAESDDPDMGIEADAQVEEDAETEPEFTCPIEEEAVCDGRCVRVLSSMEHCGTCNNRCAIGTQTCQGGACECLGGRESCGGRCVDTDQTREHCGECGNACDISAACIEGSCIEISDRPEVTGVLEQTNLKRSESQDCGVHGRQSAAGSLQLNAELLIAAQIHAEDMAEGQFLAHEGSDGSSPFARADRAGYPGQSVGENVARGYANPASVVEGWKNSDGHCINMMNGTYTELGVGHARASDGEQFWVQLFGNQ